VSIIVIHVTCYMLHAAVDAHYLCIKIIGVDSVVSHYNCVYYCDTYRDVYVYYLVREGVQLQPEGRLGSSASAVVV
jgi:hypothetical protein